MRNAGLEEAQAGIKISRRNINNLRYADDTTFMENKGDSENYLLFWNSLAFSMIQQMLAI